MKRFFFAVLVGLSVAAARAQEAVRLPEIPVRDSLPVSGTNALTWTCLYESFELRGLEIANAAGAGTATTSTFTFVTAQTAGAVTNKIVLPNLVASGTTNAANHSGIYLATNTVPVTLFYGDAITHQFTAGSNGIFNIIGRAGVKR